MNKTIGILAHVDAGKTTLSEQLLYLTGAIRRPGRVDHRDTLLDRHSIERERGITIFSDQAAFSYDGDAYTLVDTPGHVDFSAEMERSLKVLDYAVLVLSAVEGIQGHTLTLWKLLRQAGVPAALLINKMDRTGAEPDRVLEDIRRRLTTDAVDFTGAEPGDWPETLREAMAERDEALLETYLSGAAEEGDYLRTARRLMAERRLFPVFCGSALNQTGIQTFWAWFHRLTVTGYQEKEGAPFGGFVYKIRNEGGCRTAYIKVTEGRLSVKDRVRVTGPDGAVREEKVNELRRFQGGRAQPAGTVSAGELCAATGLSVKSGQYIGACAGTETYHAVPLLASRVVCPAGVSQKTVLEYFRILEDEDPMLQVRFDPILEQIQVCLMGAVQMEVLHEVVRERFGIAVSFEKPEILYQETIAEPVTGSGHFEPLRHYAEVRLRLEPGPRGSGITFASQCSQDVLDGAYQNLVRTHVFEKTHRGPLTGMPLTDVRIVLLTGRAHLKHTEGGDFREATCRAIRQGLFKGKSLLLEPFYAFRIEAPAVCAGHILSDIQRLSGSFDPPQSFGGETVITGRGPVSAFMQYSAELTEVTRGAGRIALEFGGYEPCHNPEEVAARIGYERERDVENPADSVFCSHGAGYGVKWHEADRHMHCPL